MEKALIALGPKARKSFVITLPVDWVRAHGMDKSRKADFEIVGNSAVVRPLAREKSRAVLDAREYANTLHRVLIILYKKGIDQIKITNASPKIINSVSSTIEQRCIGFEITDQGKNYCLISDVAKESAEDFQTLLRRCFLITLQLFEENDAESLKNLDKSLNKLTSYCQRLLNKQGYSEFQNVNYYSRLCSELERIGDAYMQASREGQKISGSVCNLLRRAYELFYKFSPKEFDSLQASIPRWGGRNYFEKSVMQKISAVLGIIYGIRG
ncbi:MAG: hypothetical protein HY438_01870 [DPANN group archaeon]|nr:hypothetical protein [DPANN group archaeon]